METRELTPKMKQIIESAFDAFDVGQDNQISVQEMSLALQKIDPNATAEEISILVDAVDEDGSGDVSRDEFQKFLEKKLLGVMDENEMYHKFEASFDTKRTGLIPPHVLRQMLMREGRFPLSEAEANEFVELAMTAGGEKRCDGLIEYRPFLEWLKAGVEA
jgi:Ca2+-binding EF-hand superfamily protein